MDPTLCPSRALPALVAGLDAVPPVRWPDRLVAFARDGLRAALDHLLADERRLAEVASRSYVHANGFAKLVLHLGEAMAVRLHVARGASEDNIHDHRWPFASVVLAGELENVLYGVDERGTPLPCWHYVRDLDGTGLEPAGIVRVAAVSRRLLRTGEAYGQDPAPLHRIRWGTGCRTLVVTGRPVATTCRLLSDRPDPQVRGRPLHPDHVRALLAGSRR